MDTIKWPILGISHVTPKEFVQFWEQLYSGYDEDFYQENIGQPLSEERIAAWFVWKNGTVLSADKKQSLDRYYSPEERISQDANADEIAVFLNKPGGAIWRI